MEKRDVLDRNSPSVPFNFSVLALSGATRQLSQRESPWHGGKVSGQTSKLAVSPEPLPLGEVSPQVTERARPLPENAAAAVLRSHPSTHCVRSKTSAQTTTLPHEVRLKE